ncbi:MAG: flagellar hook assembly protein FlgD [Pseudomonadales bacterium]|nr:flagellar hook assembly protein FlgD [Pseudomonadales bacterium]
MISFDPTVLGGTATSQSSGSGSDELGQDDFLRLLVAQMQNQDPVNPVENNEFLGQIAQFSMVSGIEEMSSSFGGFQTDFFSNQAMEAAQLVGKEVLVDNPNVSFEEGQQVSGNIQANGSLHAVNINVYSAAGDLVRTIDYGSLNPGLHAIAWDGLTDDGESAVSGDYRVEATALLNGESTTLPVQLFHRVESTSIDHGSGQIALNLSNAESINFSLVKEIR